MRFNIVSDDCVVLEMLQASLVQDIILKLHSTGLKGAVDPENFGSTGAKAILYELKEEQDHQKYAIVQFMASTK